MTTSPSYGTDGNDDNGQTLPSDKQETPGVESGNYELPEEIGVLVGETHSDQQVGV